MADTQLVRVEKELEVLQTELTDAKAKVKALENSEPDADTEKEKWARWDKKMVAAQKELEQLRTKEEQLRTEKLLLLQQATPSAAPGEAKVCEKFQDEIEDPCSLCKKEQGWHKRRSLGSDENAGDVLLLAKQLAEQKLETAEQKLKTEQFKHCAEVTELKNQVASSSELAFGVLADPDSKLASYFEDAREEDFWISKTVHNLEWEAPWEDFANIDKTKTETKVIQPAWDNEFRSACPSKSKWAVFDTHNGCQKLTQDSNLHLADRPWSELSTGAMIELVGQDETGWPSKSHKAKFVRDLLRMYRRRGGVRVHGILTDLARIIVMELKNVKDGVPQLRKTATQTGPEVKAMFMAFAAARPEDLGVRPGIGWYMKGNKNFDVFPDRVLGTGAHGSVYLFRRETSEDLFVKDFPQQKEFHTEVSALKALENVHGVPTLHGVDNKHHAFAASPVCSLLATKRGQLELIRVAVSLVCTLQGAHQMGIIHRDVRPSNLLVSENNDAVLADWACSIKTDTEVNSFTGTMHYAAVSVLRAVASGKPYTPAPAHDLESLVFTMHDLFASEPPDILAIPRSNVSQLLEAREDLAKGLALARVLQLARTLSYENLKEAGAWAALVKLPSISEEKGPE